MRFTSALIAGSLAVAVSAADTTMGTPTSSIDPVQSSIEACVHKCEPGDVGCLSRCNPVPNPNRDQVAKTHDCIAKCDQGDGTKAETKKYADCVAVCVKDNYYDGTQGTPNPTGGSGNNNNGDDDNVSSATGGSGGSSSSNGSSPTKTGGGGSKATESGSASESGSPTKSGSRSEETASGTESGNSPSSTGKGGDNGDNAGTGLVASSAALFGALAAVFAL